MEKFSLDALAREHLKRARDSDQMRSAETVYGGHEHVLRQTLIGLAKDAEMAEHASPGEATLIMLTGRVRLATPSADWDARTGDLLVVPRERHSIYALEDAAFLLTVVKQA